MAVPSLDARIAAKLGLRPEVRRVPIFGLGCVAEQIGASGPDILDSRSHLYPDSLRTMGWESAPPDSRSSSAQTSRQLSSAIWAMT